MAPAAARSLGWRRIETGRRHTVSFIACRVRHCLCYRCSYSGSWLCGGPTGAASAVAGARAIVCPARGRIVRKPIIILILHPSVNLSAQSGGPRRRRRRRKRRRAKFRWTRSDKRQRLESDNTANVGAAGRQANTRRWRAHINTVSPCKPSSTSVLNWLPVAQRAAAA